MPKIRKLLIANRGEIAVRIIRAAKDAGISTVAIYADQDRNSRHTRLAHEAYALNGNTSAETYLLQEKILTIAKRSNADAVHPGYGFLAENSSFARAVIDAGLIWIGPPPEAIDALGDKVSARQIALSVGAPLAPGTEGPVKSAEEVVTFAKKHGLPVAIKAVHGGGGRGLKVARAMEEIPELFDSATREAIAAFGRGECFVEKFLERPRHVETQCLADLTGKVVVISTRDCSLQRRHQKLVEEAPAPFLTKEQEKALYDSSKAILKKVGYQGAGTCEFLIGQDGTISFLEVNTRLQVEHPVSEEVTGIDLVREQFRLSEGETLGYEDPKPRGHSIEFRITGEDPGNGFLPMPGPVHTFRLPGGPGIRVDSGVTTGDVVTGAFDSLLAKVIVSGRTRRHAIERAKRALKEFEIAGLPTVLPFHRAVLEEEDFVAQSGNNFKAHTNWIENDFANDIEPWTGSIGEAELEDDRYRTVVVEVEGRRLKVGVPASVFSSRDGVQSRSKAPKRRDLKSLFQSGKPGTVTSPMQATVVRVAVREGDVVHSGDLLFVLEAMKMEQPLVAPNEGIVGPVFAEVGDSIQSGKALVEILEHDFGIPENEI